MSFLSKKKRALLPWTMDRYRCVVLKEKKKYFKLWRIIIQHKIQLIDAKEIFHKLYYFIYIYIYIYIFRGSIPCTNYNHKSVVSTLYSKNNNFFNLEVKKRRRYFDQIFFYRICLSFPMPLIGLAKRRKETKEKIMDLGHQKWNKIMTRKITNDPHSLCLASNQKKPQITNQRTRGLHFRLKRIQKAMPLINKSKRLKIKIR